MNARFVPPETSSLEAPLSQMTMGKEELIKCTRHSAKMKVKLLYAATVLSLQNKLKALYLKLWEEFQLIYYKDGQGTLKGILQ